MPNNAGQSLGSRYRLDELVGRGAMGEVWRGSDIDGKSLAFKILRPEFSEDDDFVRRFLGERRLLTGVQDRHVVRVFDMVAEGETLAIVMEYVDGHDLRHRLREADFLAPGEACHIAAQVARGLAAVHSARIVHRDVKPENVLLGGTADPVVKLADFGTARLVDDDAAASQPTAFVGTPLYMAPEVINGQTPTVRADLYALGIMLYEMLCGITPFAGMATGPLLQAHLTTIPPRPDLIDDALWEVLSQLMSKDPMHRPGTGLADRLDQLATAQGSRPPLPRQPRPVNPGSAAGMHVPGGPADLATPRARSSTPAAEQTLLMPPVPGSGQLVAPPVTPPGPPQPYSAGHGTEVAPPRRRSNTPVLIGVIAALAVMIVALVVFVVRPGDATPQAVQATSQAVAEAEASPQTSSPAPSAQPPSSAWPPADTTPCPDTDIVAVNEATSCQFAMNVADAYYRNGGPGTVSAYSPVTSQWYDMSCEMVQASIAVCTGGTNATVYVRQ